MSAAQAQANGPPVRWTGFYVGAEFGKMWSDQSWTTTEINTTNAGVRPVDASSPRDFGPISLLAGGYLGYNWQFARQWVAGVEADFFHAGKKKEVSGIPGCTIACVPGFPGPQLDVSSVTVSWEGTARARLGYLLTPELLVYAAGGLAWQTGKASATCQHSGADPLCSGLAAAPFSTATDSFTRTGWTIGAGLDWQLTRNWIARAEYRFSDYGSRAGHLDLSAPGAPADALSYRLDSSSQVATIGLAYRFGN